MDGTLTEAEFRALSVRLSDFARDLTPNECLFLTAILARACASSQSALDPFPGGLGAGVCADLAYSIWQSMRLPYGPASVNPQPVPFTKEKP